MADLSNVVSFFAFEEPGVGSDESESLDFRGPGRRAVGLISAAKSSFGEDAIEDDTAAAMAGVDPAGEGDVAAVSVWALVEAEEDNCGSLYNGHFFASSQSSGTSFSSLNNLCLHMSDLSTLVHEVANSHNILPREAILFLNLYHPRRLSDCAFGCCS